jgi:hypothetical protein
VQFCNPPWTDLLELKYFSCILSSGRIVGCQQYPKCCVETNVNNDVITFTDKLFGVDSIGQRRSEDNVLLQKLAESLGAPRAPPFPSFLFSSKYGGAQNLLMVLISKYLYSTEFKVIKH